MNKRVLFLGVGAGALLGIAGVLYWYFVVAPSETPIVEPTPTPVISIGVLPSTSVTPVPFQGVCPDTWISQKDTDGDSLPDAVEAIYKSDSNNKDTDGDGFNDGEEVRAGYNPMSTSARLDSDNDGLLDHDECKWGTDPFNPDSDEDGFQDGAEVKNGFDPTKKGDGNGSDKIPVVTPVPTATPIATKDPKFSPTPAPTVSGQVRQTPPPNTAQLSLVSMNQLQITSATSSADVKAYLVHIDSLRPQEFSDGQVIASAIADAANGNVQPLAQVRAKISQFAAALKGTPTPKPAQEYHQLYVTLIEFTASQLQIIEQNASGANQQKAVQAVLDIQNILPPYLTQLSQLRAIVEGISNQ
ncbi:MAG: hypothetical protein O3A36_01275 [bacterium]|nr:hypothetical protein [bacterium]